jgi:hypothetical protein
MIQWIFIDSRVEFHLFIDIKYQRNYVFLPNFYLLLVLDRGLDSYVLKTCIIILKINIINNQTNEKYPNLLIQISVQTKMFRHAFNNEFAEFPILYARLRNIFMGCY